MPLPGDRTHTDNITRMIRVNHAGEYGAKRIYQGQLDVLRKRAKSQPTLNHTVEVVEHMAEQEQAHLEAFEQHIREKRIRPTALHPLWHALGYAMGAGTALMGPKAAMACTVAVESVIDQHYAEQLAELGTSEPELSAQIQQFRDEELEHHNTGLNEGAAEATGYPLLRAAIERVTKSAIYLSQRL